MPTRFLRTLALALASTAFVACNEQAPTSLDTNNDLDDTDVTALAATLDVQAAEASSTGDDAAADSYRDAAQALRFGVRPTQIAVSVAGTTERYQAVATAVVRHLTVSDIALHRSVVAWHRGDRPLALLHITTLGDEGSFSSADEPASDPRSRAEGVWVNFSRNARYRATAGTAAIGVISIGGECNFDARTFPAIRCAQAEFRFAVDGLFRLHGASPEDGADAVRIMVEPQRVSGVVLARNQSESGRSR